MCTLLPLLSALLISGCADETPTGISLEHQEPIASISDVLSITDVRAISGSGYQAVNAGFVDGAKQYVDRAYPFVSVPAELSGASYIRTANKDQGATGTGNFLTFSVDRGVEVYVGYEEGQPVPGWIKNAFTATDLTVAHQKSGMQKTFRFYQKSFPAGPVALGSNRTAGGAADMYTVVVKATEVSTATATTQTGTTSAFSTVVNGIRPRGYGSTTYTLAKPATGRKTYYVATTGSDSNPGTSTAPFRTINRAAQVAIAGDVVTIRPGTYRESVSVRNAGTATSPIIFQASQRGQVVLTGGSYHFVPVRWHSGVMQTGAVYVTLRGLIFRDYAPKNVDTKLIKRAAVGAIRGWKIEDCLFDRAGYNGVDIRGNDVTVVRSTFQYTHTNAITAWAPSGSKLHNTRVLDVVLWRNHTRAVSLTGVESEKVVKFYRTNGTLVDNVESYENNGPGWWFDTENTNYTVRNSYLHHNVTGSGRGMFIEINFAPGLIENNVFAHNTVTGLTLANSQGVTVRNNLFLGSPRSMLLMAADRPGYPLKDIRINGNHFKGWSQRSGIHPGGVKLTKPGLMNIMANGNTYDPGSSAELTYWPHTGWVESITEMRNKLGWETTGRIGDVLSPL